jgi:hypothetical protein
VLTDANTVFSIPSAGKPGYLGPQLDPTFSTWVCRIAADPGTTGSDLTGGGYTWGTDARQEYSKDQPWSADGSLLFLENTEGTGTTPDELYLDGLTYQVKYRKTPHTPSGSHEGRWMRLAGYPASRLIAGYPGSTLRVLDVPTDTVSHAWTLPVSVTGVGPDEGNTSADGRYVALVEGTDLSSPAFGGPGRCRMFVFDLQAGTAGPRYDLYSDGGVPIDGSWHLDWVSVSPSGSYVVAAYGTGSFDALRVFDVAGDLTLTPRANANHWHGMHGPLGTSTDCTNGFIYTLGHADMAPDPGDSDADVIIGQDGSGNAGTHVTGITEVNAHGIGHVVKVKLADNTVSSLTDYGNGTSVAREAFAHHVSCRNYARPGWCYVTYEVEPGKRYSGEVVAVATDGSGSVERYAHYHSDYSNLTGSTGPFEAADSDYDYRSQGHAVPSPDGARIVVASNWVYQGNGGQPIQAYVLGGNVSTATVYTNFAKEIGDTSAGAQINLGSNTLKVALLTSSYTPARDTDQYWSDISASEASGTGYTAGGQTLAGVAWTKDATNHRAVLTATNPSWSSATITFRYAVVYKSTGTAGTSPLICYCDFGSNQTATNGTVTIQYDSTNGVINLTTS